MAHTQYTINTSTKYSEIQFISASDTLISKFTFASDKVTFTTRSSVTINAPEVFQLYDDLLRWEDLLEAQFTNKSQVGNYDNFTSSVDRTSDTIYRSLFIDGHSTGSHTYYLNSDMVFVDMRDGFTMSWADYRLFTSQIEFFEGQVKDMRFKQLQ